MGSHKNIIITPTIKVLDSFISHHLIHPVKGIMGVITVVIRDI
jgi:hypothetical protein